MSKWACAQAGIIHEVIMLSVDGDMFQEKKITYIKIVQTIK